MELRAKLAEETGTVEFRRDLARGYYGLGFLYNDMARHLDSEEMYLKSLDLNEKLTEETKTAESLNDLAMNYKNLGIYIKPWDVNQKKSNTPKKHMKGKTYGISFGRQTGSWNIFSGIV